MLKKNSKGSNNLMTILFKFFLLFIMLLKLIPLSYTQTSIDNKRISAYDISILLNAQKNDGVGFFPDLKYDFSKIPQVPIFNQQSFSLKKIKGLISNNLKEEIISSFDKFLEPPISFPYNAVIYGIRLDMCKNINLKPDLKNCIPELRLVGEAPILEDRSVHLIYEISKVNANEMLNKIKVMNSKCSALKGKKGLEVHPCSHETWFITSINAQVKQYAKEEKLKKVTFQVLTSDNMVGAFWRFAGIEKKKDTWNAVNTHATQKNEEFFGFGEGSNLFEHVNLNNLDKKVSLGLKNELEREELINLITHLEDSAKRTPENTSCLSCHASQALRARDPLMAKETYFETTLEQDYSPNKGKVDIRHFGYRHNKAKISSRVKKETKSLVDFINSFNN